MSLTDILLTEFGERAAHWLKILAVILVLFIAIYKFGNSLFLKFYGGKRVTLRENHWLRSILVTLIKPLTLITLILISYSIVKIVIRPNPEAFRTFSSIHNVLLAMSIAWLMLRMIKNFENYFTQYIASTKTDNSQVKIDKAAIDILAKLLSLVTILFATLSVLNAFGFGIETLIAFGSIAGVAIGWGARDFMSSLFGTIIVYLDKPFILGDRIKLVSQKNSAIEGFVERINWRFTKIRTLDEGLVIVPNLLFTSITVENITMSAAKRINVLLTIPNQSCHDLTESNQISTSVKTDVADTANANFCQLFATEKTNKKSMNCETFLMELEKAIFNYNNSSARSTTFVRIVEPIRIETEAIKISEILLTVKLSVFYTNDITAHELRQARRHLFYTIATWCNLYDLKFEASLTQSE